MEILPVTHPSFQNYGAILEGYDLSELLRVMERIIPVGPGTDYVPGNRELEALPACLELEQRAFGGMPIQLGWCCGHNTKLNCLEYHRDSEVNLGVGDFILLVAKREELEDGALDTKKVRAFYVPAGVLVEVYATTLHYAPCSPRKGEGFQVLVALPRGTNGPMPEIKPRNREDTWLWACNKWLLAHKDAPEAAQGAYVGLTGENIDIESQI